MCNILYFELPKCGTIAVKHVRILYITYMFKSFYLYLMQLLISPKCFAPTTSKIYDFAPHKTRC